jgi:hypothetical protein
VLFAGTALVTHLLPPEVIDAFGLRWLLRA